MNRFQLTLFCKLFLFGLCYGDFSENKTLKWPEIYHFRGEKIVLFSGIVEPFEIWYHKELNKSRKDFYNGTVKTFYFGETENATDLTYTVYPVTTEEDRNTIVCERSESFESGPNNFLPDIDTFTYQGDEVVLGKKTEKWINKVEDSEERIILMLWAVRTENGENVPIMYQHQEFNLWRGEMTRNVVVNFYDFHDYVTESNFNIPSDVDCNDPFDPDGYTSHWMSYDPDIVDHLDRAFHVFKDKHQKSYEHNKEHNYRKKIFRNNLQRVISKNRQNLPYKLEINHFADRTPEELRMVTGLRGERHKDKGSVTFPHSEEHVKDLVSRGEIPKNLDLRVEGMVTPVKDQLACGSCWAFTTTAAIEGAISKSNGGRLLSLSEQSFVDCSWGFENAGCNGGLLTGAFKWALKYGVPTTEEYGPYLEKNGYCKIDNMTDVYKIKGYAMVTPHSKNAMKVALFKYGPVAVAIHASYDMFLYKSGIFYDVACDSETDVNHGVLVVGYGELNGQSYWILKNSWGPLWGEEGYMLISTRKNNCLILNQPYYAVV